MALNRLGYGMRSGLLRAFSACLWSGVGLRVSLGFRGLGG